MLAGAEVEDVVRGRVPPGGEEGEPAARPGAQQDEVRGAQDPQGHELAGRRGGRLARPDHQVFLQCSHRFH
jgi:hypothetical protein